MFVNYSTRKHACLSYYLSLYLCTPQAESRALFVIILLANMLYNIIQEIITLSNGSRQASATAAMVMFVLVAALFTGSLTIVHFVYLCVLKHHYTSFIISSIITIGGILNYYGDNILDLIYEYDPELDCDETCVENFRTSAVFSLGLSLIIFRVVLPIVQKFSKKRHAKKKTPNWISALDMITILVTMDTLYSAVVMIANSEEFCGRADTAIATSFICLSVIVGVAAEVAYWVHAQRTNKRKDLLFTCLTTIGLLAFILCYPLFLLADNHQPLDCAFGCDSYAANETAEDLAGCNQNLNSGVRLGFITISFIVMSSFSVLFFVCNSRVNEEPNPEDMHTDTAKNAVELQEAV